MQTEVLDDWVDVWPRPEPAVQKEEEEPEWQEVDFREARHTQPEEELLPAPRSLWERLWQGIRAGFSWVLRWLAYSLNSK
jgi:hypothetical protein